MQRLAPTLFACSIALAVAQTAALAVPPPPPPPVRVTTAEDANGVCVGISPNVTVAFGQTVTFADGGWSNASHTVTQRDGFWTFVIADNGEKDRVFRAAGIYWSKCDDGAYSHTVSVGMTRGTISGNSFSLRWADSNASSTYTYDVSYKIGTSGTFKNWKTGTSLRTATFNGVDGRTYYFRARTIKAGLKTDWSPLLKVSV